MKIGYKLTFKDLGCQKFRGTIIIRRINYKNLANTVKPYLKNTPDIEINVNETQGCVYIGWQGGDFNIEKVNLN